MQTRPLSAGLKELCKKRWKGSSSNAQLPFCRSPVASAASPFEWERVTGPFPGLADKQEPRITPDRKYTQRCQLGMTMYCLTSIVPINLATQKSKPMYYVWGEVPASLHHHTLSTYWSDIHTLDKPAPRQTRRDLRLPILHTNLVSQKNSYKRIASLLPKSHLFCFSPILPLVRPSHLCRSLFL